MNLRILTQTQCKFTISGFEGNWEVYIFDFLLFWMSCRQREQWESSPAASISHFVFGSAKIIVK